MSDVTSAALAAIRQAVSQAKAVPMSASVMVNKAEMLSLIDRAQASLAADFAEAQGVLENARQTTYQAKADAEAMVAEARRQAESLVANHEIVTHAQEVADATRAATQREALELRKEADAFVDSRIAELEAAMTRTLSQVRTMRARLADRSGLDEPETSVLPRLSALPNA